MTFRQSRYNRPAGLVAAAALALGLSACGNVPGRGGEGRDMPGMGGMMGGGHHHHGGMGGDRAGRYEQHHAWLQERATRELGLDSVQQDKLKALLAVVEQQRATMRGPRAGGAAPGTPRGEVEALKPLIAGDRLDRGGAKAMVQQRSADMAASADAVIAAAGDFFDSLKPEQQTKVRAFVAERSGRSMRRLHD